jgi:hypothetical protein
MRGPAVRTLLYEAANVMLTRYKGQLKLKDWAFAIAARSTMRKARVALARRLAIIMHAMLRDGMPGGGRMSWPLRRACLRLRGRIASASSSVIIQLPRQGADPVGPSARKPSGKCG